MTLAEFILRVPAFTSLAKTPSKLVPYFALFLELNDSDVVISPGILGPMFDDARVRRPANLSDVIRKSQSFVRVPGGGYRLAHEIRERLLASVGPITKNGGGTESESKSESLASESTNAKQVVFVVYGRDARLRLDLFAFLRALGLKPLEFEHMAHLTGSTSASTWEVVRAGFAHAQACVALFSPDEHVSLREDLRGDDDPEGGEMQARPNVFIEAGMALALDPKRTILVKVGRLREISDLAGMQYVRLTQDASSRNRLRGKLELAGCEITTHGDDWLKAGNFAQDAIGR